jgi:hypothetical protein
VSSARQEMLDKIISRAKLGVKSEYDGDEDGDNTCRYRTQDGNRCFVGELIPDEKYSPTIEDTPVGKHIISMIPDATLSDIEFLQDMQTVHDNLPIREWQDGLRALADKYELSFNW